VTAGAIQQLRITDVNKNPVFSAPGEDFAYLAYTNSPVGAFVAGTVLAAGHTTDTNLIFWPISVASQPCTFSLTLDTRATATGGATCTVLPIDVTINVVYEDSTDVTTLREQYNETTGSAGGVTDISSKLGQNLNVVHLALTTAANRDDADMTSITLEGNSQVQIEAMTPGGFLGWENERTTSGHQIGWYNLPISQPFVSTSSTKLSLIETVANIVRLYQFYV
jgi:hypothetical protein